MMKKLICMVLALLLFAGCSAGPRPDETKSAPTTAGESASVPTAAARPEPLGPGLYLLCTYTAEDGWRPTAMAAGGNAAVVLLSPVPADPDRPACCIQTLDLETGTAGPILPLENAGDFDGCLLSIEDDGSLVYYDPYKETAAHYDPQGRLLGRIDNPFPAGDDPRFPHRLANQYFTFQGPVAWYHSYTPERFLFTAYAFADEPDSLYLLDGGSDSVRDAKGRRLLESTWLRGNGGLSYRILDLDAGQELDRVTIENDGVGADRESTFFNEGEALLCDAGAVLRIERDRYEPGVEYGEGGPEPDREDRIYLWRPDEAAAQSVDVRRVTQDGLRAENDELVARIGERWEINVLLDTAPEGDRPPLMAGDDPEEYRDATLVTGIEPLPAYDLLKQLECFLELLPEGFTHEMQTDFPERKDEYSNTGYDGFDIYVIKEIPGSSSAYANGWEDRLKIVLATDEFSASTLPHEFMHLIEYRTAAYYDSVGEDFRAGWEALNPEGFDYFGEQDAQPPVNDCFVSSYARTNAEEDKAETFMYMFVAQEPLEECLWYRDAPHIRAKVAYLTEAIRRSFPSVQAVDKAYWESK